MVLNLSGVASNFSSSMDSYILLAVQGTPSNGAAERVVQTVKSLLTIGEWVQPCRIINGLQVSYNSTNSSKADATKTT